MRKPDRRRLRERVAVWEQEAILRGHQNHALLVADRALFRAGVTVAPREERAGAEAPPRESLQADWGQAWPVLSQLTAAETALLERPALWLYAARVESQERDPEALTLLRDHWTHEHGAEHLEGQHPADVWRSVLADALAVAEQVEARTGRPFGRVYATTLWRYLLAVVARWEEQPR